MLYIFHVDTGTMMMFEMNLALESVAHLREVIERACRIPPEKQVLLVSGGESLEPTARVCSYSAGTDTNPIFLFSKCSIESVSPPSPSIDYGSDMDLKEQVDAALSMPASYNTVVERAQLAQQFCELARDQTRICERLVHDQHLQQQGWAAVVANLEDSVMAFRTRGEAFVQSYQQHLESRAEYINVLQNFNEVLDTLSKIPVLPGLMANVSESTEGQDEKTKESNSNNGSSEMQPQQTALKSCGSAMSTAAGGDGAESMAVSKKSSGSRSGSGDEWQRRTEEKAMTLLQWISTKDNQSTLEQMVELCARSLEQFDERVLELLQQDVDNALSAANKVDMKEIKGLEERLFGLEQLMFETKRVVQEQSDLATAFHQNQTRANNLGDASILPDLCASHRRQMLVMLRNHHQLRDIRRRCNRAKEELSINLYHRLRWIMYVENRMCDVASKLMIYHENLKRLRRHLEVVRQIQMAPSMYVSAVGEVVRRRTFSQAFLVWAGDLSTQLQAVHSEELARRRDFQSRFEGHFLNTLFPGMEDCPPPFATQAPAAFDTALPKLSKEDVERLKTELPNLALSLSVPDSGRLSELFFAKSVTCTLKPDEKDSVPLEDRLVEAVTAAGLEGTLEPTLLQTADNTNISPSPSSLPLKDDRGCESETDTEEFEKVGQSPVELEQTATPAPTAEDNLGNAQLQAEQARVHLSTMGRMALAATERLHAELGQMRGQVEVERDTFVRLLGTFQSAWEQLLSAANSASSAGRALDLEVELERERRAITAKDDIIRTLTQSVEERTATVEQLEASLRQRLKVEEQQRAQTEQLQRRLEQTENSSAQSDQQCCADLERRLAELEKDRERCEDLQRRLDIMSQGTMEDVKRAVDEQKAALEAAHAQSLQQFKAEAEAEKARALKELGDKLTRDHQSQLEGLRSRFRLVACTSMEKLPSDSSLEKVEVVRGQRLEVESDIKEALTRDIEQRLQLEWDMKLQQELRNARLKHEAEQQVWFNDAMRRVLTEKDQQLEALRAREAVLTAKCQRLSETIQRLTDEGSSNSGCLESQANLYSLLDRNEQLATELEAARAQLLSMGTSVAVMPPEVISSRDAATSPEPHRVKNNLTYSANSLVQQGKISIGSCVPGDAVLVIWDDIHQSYKVLQESNTQFFVHSDCLESLGLSLQSEEGKRKMYSTAEVIDKEYCHARKSENRFHVPKGTKFYRVKVKPLQDDNLMLKSTHRHKERQQQMLQQLQQEQQIQLQQPSLQQPMSLPHSDKEDMSKVKVHSAHETEAVSLPFIPSEPQSGSSANSLPDMPTTDASQ